MQHWAENHWKVESNIYKREEDQRSDDCLKEGDKYPLRTMAVSLRPNSQNALLVFCVRLSFVSG